MKKLLFITSMLFHNYFSEAQTVVIAKKTKDAIYVGADSRATRKIKTPYGFKTDTLTVCKVFSVGKFNFAVQGRDANISAEEASKACLKYDSFEDVLREYSSSFVNRLGSTLEKDRKKDYQSYKKIMDSASIGGYGSIFFFGVNSDSLMLSEFIWFPVQYLSDEILFDRKKAKDKNCLFAGHVEEILDTLRSINVWKKGIAKTIKSLIERQAVNHPINVGGPVDIIKVTKKGTYWIQRKKLCN